MRGLGLRGRAAGAGASRPVAGAAAAAVGVAGVFGLAALGSGALEPAVAAGVLGGSSLMLLVALGWIEPLPLLVLTLPLPALYASESLRLPPAFLMSVVAVAGWSLGRGLDRRPLVPNGAASVGLLALTAALLVASPFADQRLAAARECVNIVLLLGVYAVAADRISARPDQATTVARAIAVAAALAGAAGLLQAPGVLPSAFPLADSGLHRATAGFGWPNELAMFLAVSLPFAVWSRGTARTPLGRHLGTLGLVLVAGGLAATFSRGSWTSVVAAPGVLLLARRGRHALRFWAVAATGALALDVLSGGALSGRVAATAADPLVGQRLLLTGAGLLMLQAHPWTGVGPGGFGDALEAYGPQVAGLFDYVGSAHNGYVHVAAEAGLPGFAAFAYFIVSTLRRLLRGARAPAASESAGSPESASAGLRTTCLWAFATAALVSLFEWPFAHGVGQLIVVVAALGAALSPAAPAAPAGARP